MDFAPLNLAHFHERRAEKFLRKHRYGEAKTALETSLLCLQDAREKVSFDKSIEVLDTQRWDLERKLRQIEMRKRQHELEKLKEIVPPSDNNQGLMRPESNIATANLATAQSVAKSINKTIEDFDAKYTAISNEPQLCRVQLSKENKAPEFRMDAAQGTVVGANFMTRSEQPAAVKNVKQMEEKRYSIDLDESIELPSLAPLEFPDFSLFNSAPKFGNFLEKTQK